MLGFILGYALGSLNEESYTDDAPPPSSHYGPVDRFGTLGTIIVILVGLYVMVRIIIELFKLILENS